MDLPAVEMDRPGAGGEVTWGWMLGWTSRPFWVACNAKRNFVIVLGIFKVMFVIVVIRTFPWETRSFSLPGDARTGRDPLLREGPEGGTAAGRRRPGHGRHGVAALAPRPYQGLLELKKEVCVSKQHS